MPTTITITLRTQRDGRIALHTHNVLGRMCCTALMITTIEGAQMLLDESHAVKMHGSTSAINGTYRMDVPIEQKAGK